MWGSKVGAAVLLAGIGLFGAYIPIFLRKCKIDNFVCVLNTFAAGAFLGLALFHIMPEAAQTLEKAEVFIYVGKLRTPFNVAFLLIFAGYVAVLVCEQVLNVDNHGNASQAEHRGTSISPKSEHCQGRRRGDEGVGPSRYRRQSDEPNAELTVLSAVIAPTAVYVSEACEKTSEPSASSAGVEAAVVRDSRENESAAIPQVVAGQQACVKTLTGVIVEHKEDRRETTCVTKDADGKIVAHSSSDSSKEDGVCDGEVRGGGCGLGFPCCLLAEAAAREAAEQQRRQKDGGDGAASSSATGAVGEGRDSCPRSSKSTNGILFKYHAVEETQQFSSQCCVLQQRRNHPRDSTRASAAGSDADDAESGELILAIGESLQDMGARAAADEATNDGSVTKTPTKVWRKGPESNGCGCCSEGLQQHEMDEVEEREAERDVMACDCGQRPRQKEEEQSCGMALSIRRLLSQDTTSDGLIVCPAGSSGSRSLFHPPQRRCHNVFSCEAAAAATVTRDTAANGSSDASRAEPNICEVRNGTAGSSGAAVTRAQDENCFDATAGVQRNGHTGKSEALNVTGIDYSGDNWWGTQQPQRGKLRRCCCSCRRRGSAAHSQDPPQNECTGEIHGGTCRWWLTKRRSSPHRFLSCLRSCARELDGGAFFLMVALAIHGLFEGFIVGAEHNCVSLWILTCVIGAHKWAESLLLMTQFVERRLPMPWAWTLVGLFVASSPLGIIVGACVSSGSRVAAGVCNALGAGTLLFVAAEVSIQVFSGERKQRLVQLLVYCAGAGMVFALSLVDMALEPDDTL